MTTEKESNLEKVKISSRGGKRENSGRPAGSTNKITAKEILAEAQNIIGKPLIVSLMEGYAITIQEDDRKNRVVYEKMLLDKVASQLFDVEVDDSSAVNNRQAAFLKALETIGTVAQNTPPTDAE